MVSKDKIKPNIVISKCLEFDTCRYNGDIIKNIYIRQLKPFINFITVCPEVEIGLGTPRDPIRIIENETKKMLLQEATGKELSNRMNNFSKKFISNLDNIDGFVLKSKSPSCGIKTAKIYSNSKQSCVIKKGSGLFSENIIKKFPLIPKEEELRLNNKYIREHFYTSIFTLADFRSVKTMNHLYDFQGKNKYLFMTYNQTIMKKMGKIAANENNRTVNDVLVDYYKYLLMLFSKKSRHTSNINTQMHVMGYFKKQLTNKEKGHFLDSLELYREKKVSISAVNSILLSWINRFNNKYLHSQTYFSPFPKQLINSEQNRFL